MITLSDYWRRVEANLLNAKCVAWDGCHKIYVALDDEQAEWFMDEYPYVLHGSQEAMLNTLHHWFAESCALRFIYSVVTAENMNRDGFGSLIPQCASDEDEDE